MVKIIIGHVEAEHQNGSRLHIYDLYREIWPTDQFHIEGVNSTNSKSGRSTGHPAGFTVTVAAKPGDLQLDIHPAIIPAEYGNFQNVDSMPARRAAIYVLSYPQIGSLR